MKNIAQLTQGLGIEIVRGDPQTVIRDITEDSRTVAPGSLFIARAGLQTDGRRFVRDAIARGAVAVLCDDATLDIGDAALLNSAKAQPVPCLRLAAQLAERFFGDPSSRLTLIGITGTNGKTTVAHLIHQLLNETERRCGLIGTVLTDDGRESLPSTLTTPSSIDLSRALARMVEHGCTHAVMEVSSHALHQWRVAALRFDAGTFTNLTGDHLDYHGSMEEYAAAKALLFEMLPSDGLAIVNGDDAHAQRMIRNTAAAVLETHIASQRPGTPMPGTRARIQALDSTGTRATFTGPWGEFEITLPLPGHHNVSNALQAAVAAHHVGLTRDQLRAGLARCTAPPGRLERVTPPDHPFTVYVDYAHTDDALSNVLNAARPLVPDGGRLVVLFGCGGDRDCTKRPRMAQVACRFADVVHVTSDNPRTEDPDRIVADILTGVADGDRPRVTVNVDRRRAIEECLAAARPGDVIILAGKGHEDYQIIGTTKRPFDDRLVAREALGATLSV